MLLCSALVTACIAAGTRTVTKTDSITTTATLPTGTLSDTGSTTFTGTETLPTATATSSATYTETVTLRTATVSLTLPTGSATLSETVTLPTVTVTGTDSASYTVTLPSATVSSTLPTLTISVTLTPTESLTMPTATATVTLTPTDSISITLPTLTATATETFSLSSTYTLTIPTPTGSYSVSESITIPTGTLSDTMTLTETETLTLSGSETFSLTMSETFSVSLTLPTMSDSATYSLTKSISLTPTFTTTPTASFTFTETSSLTISESLSQTHSFSLTHSLSLTPSATLSLTKSLSPTLTHSLVRYDNYSTAMWPAQPTEGQEMRIQFKATTNGVLKDLFNVTNNDDYQEELEVRVYRYDKSFKARCGQYVERDQTIYGPLFRSTQFGLSDIEYHEGHQFAETAHVVIPAPHHLLSWIICFIHRPMEFEAPPAHSWVVYTTGGYTTGDDDSIYDNYIFASKPSMTWFEINEPSTLQFAVIRVMSVDLDWNFTLPGSRCKDIDTDQVFCADGDNIKLVPHGAMCTDEAVSYTSNLFPGSASVSESGSWLPSAYPTLSASALAGGVGLFGSPTQHPLIDEFNRTAQPHLAHVFLRLPPEPGRYDICFSALEQRRIWKAEPLNTTLQSRPMWRKLWHCPQGCPNGAPRRRLWDLNYQAATVPHLEVDMERLAWSIKDVTEESWGIVRVAGGGLSREQNNATDENFWFAQGGDQLRMIVTEKAEERTANTPVLGCWDWFTPQYFDQEDEYISASRDMRAAPGQNSQDERSGVTTTYTTIYTGKRYLSRYVCYRKGADGAGWRVLPWDRSGEWSDLPPPLEGNHSYPVPEALVTGPFHTHLPGDVEWDMNDTRASTWGPLFVHEQNDTRREPFEQPDARIVLWNKPCDYKRLYMWLDGSRAVPLSPISTYPTRYAVQPEAVPPYGRPLFLTLPDTPGLYKVCFRTADHWNWRASPVSMEVLERPGVSVEVLDIRERVDTIAMVYDTASQLSTHDTLKLVPYGSDCEAPSVLPRSVPHEYCESGSVCGREGETLISDTPSIFQQIALHSETRWYQSRVGFYVTTPKAARYIVCYQQNFTSNWIVTNSSWLGEMYVPPKVVPPPEPGRSDMRSGVVRQFHLESYWRTVDNFAARLVPCGHPAFCLQPPVSTEATQFGGSTMDSIDEGDKLRFNLTAPDAPGCYYLCYLINPYTWHRVGPYTVFENNMWWSGVKNPYNTQTIEFKITSIDFPLDAKPSGVGGDMASLQLATLPCSSPGQVTATDLGLSDAKVASVTVIATLPSTVGNVGVTYKVCLYTTLPENAVGAEKSWVEIPAESKSLLTTLPAAIANWELDPILQHSGQPGVSRSGLSTVYYATPGDTSSEVLIGFSFRLHSPIVGGQVKLSGASDQGCLTSSVPGINPIISGTRAIFQMPFAAGKYLVCYKDVSGGGGWFAVGGPGNVEHLTVVSDNPPSFIKLSGEQVMLSHLSASRVTVSNTSCDTVTPPQWISTTPKTTWAAANISLPPVYQNLNGRYIICILMKDGTRYHALNKGNAVEGGGSGYFQQGLAAEALSVYVDTNQFENVTGRFVVFSADTSKAIPATAPKSATGYPSYSHISLDKRVRIIATLRRLGEIVPYGSGKVWVVPCSAAGSTGDLACENDIPEGQSPPFLISGGDCKKLLLGTAVFDINLDSGCPNVFGCGLRLRAELQGFVFTSDPVWTNIERHNPDEISVEPQFTCLSGGDCNVTLHAMYQSVREIAPTGRISIDLQYNTSNLTSGAVFSSTSPWGKGGVADIFFRPVLHPTLAEVNILLTARLDLSGEAVGSAAPPAVGATAAPQRVYTSRITIQRVLPASVEILDFLPRDLWSKSLRQGRFPAEVWHEGRGYIEANIPYTVLFRARSSAGEILSSLGDFGVQLDLVTNVTGNSLLDPTRDDMTISPAELASLNLRHGPSSPEAWGGNVTSVWQAQVRILNNVGCGRWSPCTLRLSLISGPLSVSGNASISVRVPATTIRVEAPSTRVELGTGIEIFASPGAPSGNGFLIDEYHAGDIYAWMASPIPVTDGRARGGAGLTSDSSGKPPELHPGRGFGALWVLRTTQPCMQCEATFHSTSGAGPQEGVNASNPSESFGLLRFTFLSDAVDVSCPKTIDILYYDGVTQLFDVNVTSVNAYLRLAAWPLWPVELARNHSLGKKSIHGVRQIWMQEGLAQFQGLSMSGEFSDGEVVTLLFRTTSAEYDTAQVGSVLSQNTVIPCAVAAVLRRSRNPLTQTRRLVLPGQSCEDGVCHVSASTSTFFTLSLPFEVQRLASAGWVPDGQDYNITIGRASDFRPVLVDKWDCVEVTQTCTSTPLTVRSIHPNVTMTAENGANVTVTYGAPTLRFSSRFLTTPDGQRVLARQGVGEVTVGLTGDGVALSPVHEASLSVCLLAPPSDISSANTFLALLACTEVLLTLTSHTTPPYEVRLFRAGVAPLTPILIPGVGSECGPPATELRFKAALLYQWRAGVYFVEVGGSRAGVEAVQAEGSPASSAPSSQAPAGSGSAGGATASPGVAPQGRIEFIVSTTARQVLVNARDFSKSGVSLSFHQEYGSPGVDIAVFGLDELDTEVSVSSPGVPGTTSQTKFIWRMHSAAGHAVVTSSPTSDDACFARTTRDKIQNSYLSKAPSPGRGWDVTQGVVVGVAFPLQIRVVTEAGERAYSHPNSLVDIELDTGTACVDHSNRVVQVLDENGDFTEKDARTTFGQVTVWVTLMDECIGCTITATLCFNGAPLVRCLSSPSDEPPQMALRSSTTARFSTIPGLPPVKAAVVSQSLPPLLHQTGSPIVIDVAPVLQLPGGWTDSPPRPVQFEPVITSVFIDTSPGGLRYGNGGFLQQGTSVCGIPSYDRYPVRHHRGQRVGSAGNAAPVRFSVTFVRPCSMCVLRVLHNGERFDIRSSAAGGVAVFRVTTCSQGWLLHSPLRAVRRGKPFAIALIRVDAGNSPTWAGTFETNASVVSRDGNGYGGHALIESHSGAPTRSIDGIATLRITFSRACWDCHIQSGYLRTGVTVVSQASRYIVTKYNYPASVHRSNNQTVTLSYSGYLADSNGDKAVLAGGPSVLYWQASWLKRFTAPAFITLDPVAPQLSSALVQTNEGLVTLTIADTGASLQLISGFDSVDGSPSGPLLVTVSKGPIGRFTPSLRFMGKALDVTLPNGDPVPPFDWLTPASLMLVGDGNAVTVFSGERKAVEVRFAGKPFQNQHYFTAVPFAEGLFLAVSYDCGECVNCVVDGDTRVPLNSRGVGRISFAISIGGGSCQMEVTPPASLPGFASSSVVLNVVLPAVTQWFWVSSPNFEVQGGRRSAVTAEVTSSTPRTLLLRGWSQGRLIHQNLFTQGDADQITLNALPANCFRVTSRAVSGASFNISGVFAEGRCLLRDVQGLPTGTKSTQSLEVTSNTVADVKVVPQVGYHGMRFNVSSLHVPLGGGIFAAKTGTFVELEVVATAPDGSIAAGDYITELHWEAMREVEELGKLKRYWMNASAVMSKGRAKLSVFPTDDTRGATCCSNSPDSGYPTCAERNMEHLCTSACCTVKKSPHVPWRMSLYVTRSGELIRELPLGGLFVVSWPSRVEVSVLHTDPAATQWLNIDPPNPLMSVLVGYPVTLRIMSLDVGNPPALPDYTGADAVQAMLFQPQEEPCSPVGWPGSESCTTVDPETCVTRKPPACRTSWRAQSGGAASLGGAGENASQPGAAGTTEGLRFLPEGGVAVLPNITILSSGLWDFIISGDYGEVYYKGSLFVEQVSHFTLEGSGDCTQSNATVTELVYLCPAPAAMYPANHLRGDVASPVSSLTRDLPRLNPDEPFDLSIDVISTSGKPLVALQGALMILSVQCEASGNGFAVSIRPVVEGTAVWSNLTLSGYCAVASMSIRANNPGNPLDSVNGVIVSFPPFELGSPVPITPAPAPTLVPTPQPLVISDSPTAQLQVNGTTSAVMKGIFKIAWEADLMQQFGERMLVVLDWVCVVPEAPATAGPLIPMSLKRDSVSCESVSAGGLIKPLNRRSNILLQSHSTDCTVNALLCDVAVEFRVIGNITADQLSAAVVSVVSQAESNFMRLVSSPESPARVGVFVYNVQAPSPAPSGQSAEPTPSPWNFVLPPVDITPMGASVLRAPTLLCCCAVAVLLLL